MMNCRSLLFVVSLSAGILACSPARPRTTPARTFSVSPGATGSIVQLHVDPNTRVRGPVVHVEGDWDVRVVSLGGAYVVHVVARVPSPAGAVHIVAGPRDDVRVQIDRPSLSAAPVVRPSPLPAAMPAPEPTGYSSPVSPPAPNPYRPAAETPAAPIGSARHRLRGELDTSNPWAP